MTKEEFVDLLQLLSALESWAWSVKECLPDYLQDQIATSVSRIRGEILKP